MARQVYAYDGSSGDFRVFDLREWRRQLTSRHAIDYLNNHLRASIQRDFCVASIAYLYDSNATGVAKGFFALMRIIFPVITFLGTLYKGEDNSRNAIAFMVRYLGAVRGEYKELSDILYSVYRHGLTHTHMPKLVRINGEHVSWRISYTGIEHLTVQTNGPNVTLTICPQMLFQDLTRAMDIFIGEFANPATGQFV
jgi:hypothetical protein